MIVSGLLIVGIGIWVMRQSLAARETGHAHHHHAHDHNHHHDHGHLTCDAQALAPARDIETRVTSGPDDHVADHPVWAVWWFGSLSGGDHRPAALPPP